MRFLAPFIFCTLVLTSAQIAAQAVSSEDCEDLRQFTFSWQFAEACGMEPRGGTTRGPAVKLDPELHAGWLSLKDEDISDFERDRRAILAMAGSYRTTFDFLEVAGYSADFSPAKPYQSWATEKVYVLEDRNEFISLQHIIVMYFLTGDDISGPMVMKHWRQDWQFEKSEVLAYVGDQNWRKQTVPERGLLGSWSQAVYQVDDSPRYESWGRWEHQTDFSSWESAVTRRPLPRRESSVREDYDVLEGTNRHSILPNGWLHEETNYKLVLDDDLNQVANLAKELGVNRYELIIEHDFSEGDLYLAETAEFWRDVRAEWTGVIDAVEQLHLKNLIDEQPLFSRLFSGAQKVADSGEYESIKGREEISEIISRYIN